MRADIHCADRYFLSRFKKSEPKMDKSKGLVKFPVSTKSLNPEIKIYYQNLSRKCRPRKNHFCYPESGLFFKNILNFCVSPSGACHSLSTRKGQISTLGKITWTYSLFRCDSISIFDHVCHSRPLEIFFDDSWYDYPLKTGLWRLPVKFWIILCR